MHILIAPNAFKNGLDASDAATCIERGFTESNLNCTTTCFPVADGGDGTGALIIRHLEGKIFTGTFSDPQGKNISASFGFIDNGKTAIVEMASASGLRLLNKNDLNPMLASSAGTGQMIKNALDEGAEKIIITVGGSATVEGGCGILHALGVRFLDAARKELRPVPQELVRVDEMDVSGLDERIGRVKIEIWCDVQNKLLGPDGAVAVFGPQKGATPDQLVQLEVMMDRLTEITLNITGIDVSQIISGGAAGGTAAFLHAFFQATLVNGTGQFLAITDFEKVLENADMVITGEGEVDLQTIQGKAPYGVASMAANKNIPVIAVAGKVPLEYHEELDKIFPVLLSIGHQPLTMEESIRLTGPNLIRLSRQIGNLLAGWAVSAK